MDFVRYAERSAGLVNADLADAEHLIHFLDERQWLHAQVSDRDAGALRRFVKELRPVFEASNDGDEHAVVDLLNALLAKHPVTPYIAGHQPGRWHMHVADRDSSVSELLIAESLMGLSTLVCDLGATRLGVCDASGCSHVFVDTSPNQSRRYCSDRCSSRANVAAYRARQRQVEQAKRSEPTVQTKAAHV
ncbi:MAG TPA: CGNR zinc finger domain-containing protein [Nocardioidaceae bacterium]|jgi:predicted RNA-binding Zn ribbon-like protein|nr:CGNR zinc finger domain-containing protein [Nocardioidaceae bacterium]